jgi:PKD repeat protein
MKTTKCFFASIIIISSTFFFSNCKKEDPAPEAVANYALSGDNNFAPCRVTFVSASTNAISYSWNFGDGGTSILQDPTYVYANGGTYNATLTVKNLDGIEKVINKTVMIKNVPTKLKINSIVITAMPFINTAAASWDIGSGPDVFLKFTDANSINYFTSGQFNDVVPSNLPLTFLTGFPLTISTLDFEFQILCYDFDNLDADDFIAGYYFKVRTVMPTNGDIYQPTVTFSSSNSELKFTFNVEWIL